MQGHIISDRQVYQIDLRSGTDESRAWTATRAIARALCEVVPIVDMAPLLSPDDREIGRHAAGDLDVNRATEEEQLREWWHSGRRAYAAGGPASVDDLVRHEATDPINPFRCELRRAGTRVALQYRGVLLGRMHAPALRALDQVWRRCIGDGFDGIRGWNFCPRDGFVPWHSNQAQEAGWRAYVIHCDRDEHSDFRWWDGSGVVRMPDRDGVLNLFTVRPEAPLFWHAVVANTPRVSCGFRLTNAAVARLLDRTEWTSQPAYAENPT